MREINVQDEGAADLADSTAAFERANQKLYAAGGGEIIAPPPPNGYVLRRLLTGKYAQKGGGIRLRKGVSLRGEGTKLLLRDNCEFVTITSPKNQAAAILTITADVHAGDRTLVVDATRPKGTRVFIRCGMSGYDTNEPRTFGFAAIVAVPDATHVTLDRPILADVPVATTTANNRALVVLDEVVEGTRIDGFDLINDIPNGGCAETGVDLFMGRQIEVTRVSGSDPGAALLGMQFCDQIKSDGLDCRSSIRQNAHPAKGRVLSLSGSTNIELDRISGQAFEGAFLMAEFFCENIRLASLDVANTFVGRNNDHMALFFVQASALNFDNLRITGNGAYAFDDGGVGSAWGLPPTIQVRNLKTRTSPPLNWPAFVPVDGYRMVA